MEPASRLRESECDYEVDSEGHVCDQGEDGEESPGRVQGEERAQGGDNDNAGKGGRRVDGADVGGNAGRGVSDGMG